MGSDDESSHGGRYVANHAPTVASSVLHHDIAGRQHYLRAIVKLDDYVTGEKDPEIRRVGPVHAGFVAFLYVHPDGTIDPTGRRFWNATAACCNASPSAGPNRRPPPPT